jgi:tetratricopeptide (TPR) repeat protein
VLNYLAYSWLEKKINLDKAKEMLVEAVNVSKGRGYILDSLGWAYFLLKDYDKAEEILQTAYEKEPSEAVIYDHYGDVLWTNGKEIQARYVWQNAIKLKNIEQDLKESINKKIIFGLDYADKNKS